MLEKLKELKIKFELITGQIADPEIIADQERWQKLCKEHAELTPIIEKYEELLKAKADIDDAAEMLKEETDPDMREMLKEEGISASVINMHTVKPLDTELLISEAKKTGAIVTSEEHNIIGGLGSAVAEALCETCPVPVVKHGVNDEFGRSGPAKELIEYYGLTAAGIVEKAKIAISLKK